MDDYVKLDFKERSFVRYKKEHPFGKMVQSKIPVWQEHYFVSALKMFFNYMEQGRLNNLDTILRPLFIIDEIEDKILRTIPVSRDI
ncbi:MAG: hypothetical protein HC896_16780 [Bacteroidales bacterium]|nr:hypothetical protein [Bacteroidales bacterium]